VEDQEKRGFRAYFPKSSDKEENAMTITTVPTTCSQMAHPWVKRNQPAIHNAVRTARNTFLNLSIVEDCRKFLKKNHTEIYSQRKIQFDPK